MIHKSNFIPEHQTITKRGQIAHSKWLEDNTEPPKGDDWKNSEDWVKHETALKRYNERRFKYPGFELDKNLGMLDEQVFTNDELLFTFRHDKCIEFQIIDKAVYRGEITTEGIVKSICKAFNINLETT